MKVIVKLFFLYGVVILAAFSCDKEPQVTAPGLAVYKTKGDYFYNVSVQINEKGEIYMYPAYYFPKTESKDESIDPRIKITEDDTVYTLRTRLIDGYIFGGEIAKNSIFLDFTFKEYLRYQIEHNSSEIPKNVLNENILDADPFLELYIDPNRPRKYELSDSAQINQMIRNYELEKYFEKIK